jgi:hypothetical protein
VAFSDKGMEEWLGSYLPFSTVNQPAFTTEHDLPVRERKNAASLALSLLSV